MINIFVGWLVFILEGVVLFWVVLFCFVWGGGCLFVCLFGWLVFFLGGGGYTHKTSPN